MLARSPTAATASLLTIVVSAILFVSFLSLSPATSNLSSQSLNLSRPLVLHSDDEKASATTKPSNLPTETPLADSWDEPPLYPEPPPRLTIIAIWVIKEEDPIYLPNFFASIAANPSIDLLFVKYDKRSVGCQRAFAPHIQNVREICLSAQEYWTLHKDFVCKQWRGCTETQETQETQLMEKLRERGQIDYVNSHFRPFRSAIFDQWINPRTEIWGWCDMDTFMGDFERNFPWDIARDYDFLFPAPPSYGDNMLLYFPGHLAFFRNSPRVVQEFFRFPNFQSIDAFMDLPWLTEASEEAEYSFWAFTHTSLTFLRFPGMVESELHFSSPDKGTFAIREPWNWKAATTLGEVSNKISRAALSTILANVTRAVGRSTFTTRVKDSVANLRQGEYSGVLWFPKKYAVEAMIDCSSYTDATHKLFIMRREPNQPVFYRFEPNGETMFPIPRLPAHPTETEPPIYVWDMLYKHFQSEKYSEWWKLPGLPPRPISSEEILFVDQTHGALVWNTTGDITFEARL
ncbi:hypothetical protein ONZ45_g1758 [Pleurotus djamor]|nr:hypothetical protein ONZ45_g1758 [Pleurotus djamor]